MNRSAGPPASADLIELEWLPTGTTRMLVLTGFFTAGNGRQPQLVQLDALIPRETLSLSPFDPVLLHPIPECPRVDPQIIGNMSNRLARLPNNPDRTLTELRVNTFSVSQT